MCVCLEMSIQVTLIYILVILECFRIEKENDYENI